MRRDGFQLPALILLTRQKASLEGQMGVLPAEVNRKLKTRVVPTSKAR
jgi:hypothetical protein